MIFNLCFAFKLVTETMRAVSVNTKLPTEIRIVLVYNTTPYKITDRGKMNLVEI